MQRLGLCCLFVEEPIRFRTTTARYCSTLIERGEDPLQHIGTIVQNNLDSLLAAVTFCAAHKIGSFRISSKLFPVYTHPEMGYNLDNLPESQQIRRALRSIKERAKDLNIRLTFHPDQFVILNSPKKDVVDKSLVDLEYHGLIAHLLGADVINIHAGGGYGDKTRALQRFAKNFCRLSNKVQSRLTIENDDRIFSPQDLLPLCNDLKIPLVYDVHHHRCLPDIFTIGQATSRALATWNREPLFHISSPKDGWKGTRPLLHHDYVNPDDVPEEWIKTDPLTIDVEAKAKEIAVLRLYKQLKKLSWNLG